MINGSIKERSCPVWLTSSLFQAYDWWCTIRRSWKIHDKEQQLPHRLLSPTPSQVASNKTQHLKWDLFNNLFFRKSKNQTLNFLPTKWCCRRIRLFRFSFADGEYFHKIVSLLQLKKKLLLLRKRCEKSKWSGFK